jgi:hypothetical protein
MICVFIHNPVDAIHAKVAALKFRKDHLEHSSAANQKIYADRISAIEGFIDALDNGMEAAGYGVDRDWKDT